MRVYYTARGTNFDDFERNKYEKSHAFAAKLLDLTLFREANSGDCFRKSAYIKYIDTFLYDEIVEKRDYIKICLRDPLKKLGESKRFWSMFQS